LILCAKQLGHYLSSDPAWSKGYCPICGSLPALAVLDHDGRRSLHCGFCWHVWPTRRIFCPFCDNTEANSLPYLYSEQEKELRADTCEHCKKYIKTVDMRAADRTLYAPLEHVASLHVDINAQERGYASGSETTLQI
jgi:FdhE protein